MENGQAKLDWIQQRLAEGMTVMVASYGHATKVTPKTAKRWAEAERPLFKVDSTGTLLMARGKHYDAIGGCALRAYN